MPHLKHVELPGIHVHLHAAEGTDDGIPPQPESVDLNKEGHDYEEELADKLSQSYFVLPSSRSDLCVV